ncbi:HupE/UreJ family protein [Ensifer sp. MPMI2T]|nr:HupE/UreJ family protein [Ensifer sp. MPMI2T]
MTGIKYIKLAFAAIMIATASKPALSHLGVGSAKSFAAGLAHPLFAVDHVVVMVSVGLWAALKGGRALCAWPAAFAGLMIAGGVAGIAGLSVSFVEPVILASLVTIGLLVAAVVNLPLTAEAIIISFFAFFHGHAHGTEIPLGASALGYLTGFALATLLLQGAGIGLCHLAGQRFQGLVRLAGAVTATVGVGLIIGTV